MARPLRIEIAGGRYHVSARGNYREPIFRQDADRLHFLALLGELGERLGARTHAYVLMDDHFHLLLETPEGNLSRAMQWLGVSYSLWFNQRHNRAGHLFAGRFKSVIVEDDAGWQEVARYVHLNPVRVSGLKLRKRDRTASRAGLRSKPHVIAQQLRLLREYRWSSYPAYAGYCAVGWLCREPLARLCGGRTEAERREAIREYTEQPVRQGTLTSPWERLVASQVLGSEEFVRRLRAAARANRQEQPSLRNRAAVPWRRIVSALETAKGERWTDFSGRYGDWGRDAALWLGRRQGRLRLTELGKLAGGLHYASIGQAISRFDKRLKNDEQLSRQLRKVIRLVEC